MFSCNLVVYPLQSHIQRNDQRHKNKLEECHTNKAKKTRKGEEVLCESSQNMNFFNQMNIVALR